MALTDRATAYATAFPQNKASHLWTAQEQGRDVLYGRWLLGNDYRNKTEYYGAYPPGYLKRVMALFPDAHQVLHMFSGSLPPGDYTRVDLVQPAEYQCSVYDFPQVITDKFFLVLADPPYTAEDAKRYTTPMISRHRALAALAACTQPGGFLVWLDTCWPMHSKEQWLTVGRITITRSTNHRTRDVTIFQRR
jgi:hypothetical protein